MKAKLLIFAVTAVMMAFTACIKERIVYVEKEEAAGGLEVNPGEGIVKFSLSEKMSRAARPVASSENTINVNTIVFKFCKYDDDTEDTGNKIAGVFDGLGNPLRGVTYSGNTITLDLEKYDYSDMYIKIQDLTTASKYYIFAYGYNKSTGESDLNVSFSGGKFTYSASSYQDKDGNPTRLNHIDQEIFAGFVETEVNEHGLFNKECSLTLERQVAGLLAYMSQVPAYVLDDKGVNRKVTAIKIVTGMTVTGIKFPEYSEYNGVSNSYGIIPLLTFDVTKADDYIDKGIGDILTFENQENKILLANEMEGITLPTGFACDENTLFGGCFLCPFDSDRSNENFNTLEIVYYDGEAKDEEEYIIKSVPLKTDKDVTDSNKFNICRNNFYSIGTKETIENPDDKDEGKDKPLPIDPGSGIDRFGVSISIDWEIIHNITNK